MSSSSEQTAIVLGAGIIGISVAYFLAQRDYFSKVIILEREASPALGASGKAGGFLARTWCDGTELGPLAQRSFELHTSLLKAKFGDEVGYRNVDTLSIRYDESHSQPTNTQRFKRISAILPEWIDPSGVKKCDLYDTMKNTAQVHPRLLCDKMLSSALSTGRVELRTGVCVLAVKRGEGQPNQVDIIVKDEKSPQEAVMRANVVVVACGVWSYNILSPHLPTLQMIGLKSHSIVLKPKSPVTAHAVFLTFEGVDGRTTEPEVYPRPDGTVYLCGEAEKQLPSKEQSISQVTVKESAIQRLRQVAEALSPNLRDSTLEISQACILPVPSDHLPLIGPIKCVPGLYCATGHTWWGILNAPATGEALAELIIDGKTTTVDLRPFDPNRYA